MASYHSYINKLNSISQVEVRCGSCGAYLFSLKKVYEGFCCFCESYTNLTGSSTDSNPSIASLLISMNKALVGKAWVEGAGYADQLAATKDIHALYGAANFYSAFSTNTYYDVNYNLSGFMYENAEKRSADLAKNKYNAMAITSKSREYFYKTLKLVGDMKSSDEDILYLEFISNIKLNRIGQAYIVMKKIAALKSKGMIEPYADMVYLEKVAHKNAMGAIVDVLDLGNVNGFYYLASHLSKEKRFSEAKMILNKLVSITGPNIAYDLLGKISKVEIAMNS